MAATSSPPPSAAPARIGFEFNPEMVALSRRKRARSGRRRPGDVRRRRHVRGRHLEGHRARAVPAAEQSRQARAEISRAEARHAHGEQHVPGDRAGTPTHRKRSKARCTSWCTSHLNIVPAQGRRHVAPRHERPDADAGISDGVGHARARRRSPAAASTANRSPSRSATHSTPARSPAIAWKAPRPPAERRRAGRRRSPSKPGSNTNRRSEDQENFFQI